MTSSEIKTWQERFADLPGNGLTEQPMQEEITDLRAALAERESEFTVLDKNCKAFEQETHRLNDQLFALRTSLAERDAEIARLINQNYTLSTALGVRDSHLRAAAQQGLDALSMPCDRWNAQQSKIVNAARATLNAALEVKP